MIDDYTMREIARFRANIARIDSQSLADRRAARADAMIDIGYPGLIEERASWLVAGHCGCGAYYAFRALSNRANRRAWLFLHTLAIEWGVSIAHAQSIWRDLPIATRARINDELDRAMREDEEEGD